MDKIEHTVGDTVILKVTVNDLSDNYSDVSLKLYRRIGINGLTDLIKEVLPKERNGNTFIFEYNTNDFIKKPLTYYGHFSISNDGKILNIFYKFKAKY